MFGDSAFPMTSVDVREFRNALLRRFLRLALRLLPQTHAVKSWGR
jgi:hypothetical protein